MSKERNCFTFLWKIKNFNFSSLSSLRHSSEIASPPFSVPIMGETQFQLLLYPDSRCFPNCVVCYIVRKVNNLGPKQFKSDYELSFVNFEGTILHAEKYVEREILSNGDTKGCLHVARDEVFLHKKELFMPDDILTICCRMWDVQRSMSHSGTCFAETKIETGCRFLVGTIEEFSCVEPREEYPICIKSPPSESLFSMSLHVAADGKLNIEMKPAVSISFSEYKCVVFISDVFGNKIKAGKGEFFDKQLKVSIPLIIQKEFLIENKRCYFPNNFLTIEFEITFPNGKTTESTDSSKYGINSENIQEIISNTIKTKFISEEYRSEKLTTLKDDLNSLFIDGILCDTEIKTATEAFQVHKNVLSARSPVFKTMFTTDMREKSNNCIDIDDLDADTVRRMLRFMYMDILDELDYDSAKKLYFAADKYNIVSLKFQCISFFIDDILPSNCCDILLLADKHQEKCLKNAVQDYITTNDNAVLFSDEWKNFEKNHPHLAIEVLRAVYIRNRKC